MKGVPVADRVRVTINTDADLKLQAQQVFSEMGLSLAAGIEIYLRAVVREKAIPFPVVANKATEKEN